MADPAPGSPETPGPIRGGIFAWFAANTVAANLIMLLFIVSGALIARNLTTEAFPEIDPRLIQVSVTYPGATPEEVEESITRRAEEAVLGIEGVDRVRSSALENYGSVQIELSDFADAQKVKDDVETAIDQLQEFPPEEAEQVRIVVVEPTSVVMRLVIAGDVGEAQLRHTAEAIERDLLALDGVSLVNLQGARSYEIAIQVSEEMLRRHGLSHGQVASAVRAASVSLSGGTLRTEGADILLRMDAERREAAAFEDIVIRSDESGRRLLLEDIATIVDGFEDAEFLNTYNGEQAVFLRIDRSSDEDAFSVRQIVGDYLKTFTPPPGITVRVTQDATQLVRDRLSLLLRNGVMGLALVFVFLALTLDLRLAFWTSLGIPISFLGSFILFGQIITLNMVTLFGLIVVLGIVVDDAIVVGENIYEKNQEGMRGVRASMEGAMGVFAPVIVGVLTTMAAFAPLIFSPGILGQIMRPVPIVVISVLAVSIIEAFFILPAHLAHGTEWSVGAMARVKRFVQSGLFGLRDRIVVPLVKLAATFRYATVAVALGIIIVCAGLVAGGFVRFIFFPVVEGDEVTVKLAMPEGTPFEVTRDAADRIVAAGYDAVGGRGSAAFEGLSATVGGQIGQSTGPDGGGGTSIGANLAQFNMELVSSDARTLSADEVERRWREAIGTIPGAESLTFTSSPFSGGADISVDLSHVDNDRLDLAVDELVAALGRIEGVSEIESSAELGKRQIEFRLTRAGEAAGLTVRDLASQVRQAFFGDEVERIQRGREEVKVYVRFPQEGRRSIADLERLRIQLPNGGQAPLSVVADLQETQSFASIDRVDGRRVISVSADVDETVTTPNAVNQLLSDAVLPDLREKTRGLTYSFEGQSREQQEELGALSRNLSIAAMIMFVLLASVLRSYVQPLVILAAIPFGAVGALLGHLMMGYDLSFLSAFGVVAVSGVVVNGSVVLIDLYNQLRKEGAGAREAAIAAVTRRFRPILLTTLTTFLGLLPIMTETSLQAQFLIPMALSLAFGIVFASMMIFVLVPALLLVIEDVGRLFGRRAMAPQAAE